MIQFETWEGNVTKLHPSHVEFVEVFEPARVLIVVFMFYVVGPLAVQRAARPLLAELAKSGAESGYRNGLGLAAR
ncbi:MAG TPA: hypothetical protein VGM44_25245 [Polyangiaceae bacterium]